MPARSWLHSWFTLSISGMKLSADICDSDLNTLMRWFNSWMSPWWSYVCTLNVCSQQTTLVIQLSSHTHFTRSRHVSFLAALLVSVIRHCHWTTSVVNKQHSSYNCRHTHTLHSQSSHVVPRSSTRLSDQTLSLDHVCSQQTTLVIQLSSHTHTSLAVVTRRSSQLYSSQWSDIVTGPRL